MAPVTVVVAHSTMTEFALSSRDRLEPTVILHKSEAGYFFGVLSPTTSVWSVISPVPGNFDHAGAVANVTNLTVSVPRTSPSPRITIYSVWCSAICGGGESM